MIQRINSFRIKNDRQIRSLLFLFTSIFLAVFAKIAIDLAPDQLDFWSIGFWSTHQGNSSSPAVGLFLFFIAGILFIISISISGFNPEPLKISTAKNQVHFTKFGFWITSLGLSFFTCLFTAQSVQDDKNGYLLSFLWILSIFLFSVSVFLSIDAKFPKKQSIKYWLLNHRTELIVLLLLITGTILVRVIDLEYHPYAFVNDEGEMGKGALCILWGNCSNIFANAWATLPVATFLPDALSILIFGNSAFAVRFASAIIGTLSVVFTYLSTREMFGKKVALIAGLILASFSLHLHFSRLGVINIIDSLSYSIMIWSVLIAASKGSAGYYLSSGFIAGLCMYTYPGSRLSPILAAVSFGMIALRTPEYFKNQWKNISIFFITAIITFAPLGTYFYFHANEFAQRLNQEGIIQNGTLFIEAQNNHINPLLILARQFIKSILVFFTSSAPSQFFNSPRAYFSPLMAIFFVLGLVLLFWRAKDLRYFLLSTWFFTIIIFGSTLTGGAPSNQRLLGSSPVAAIIAAIGVFAFLTIINNSLPNAKWAGTLVSIFFLSLLVVNFYLDMRFYFVDYRSGNFFEDFSNEVTFESRGIINQLGSEGAFYLIGDPMTYVIFGNFGYFSPYVLKEDFNTINIDSLSKFPKDKDALFLAIPSRLSDLEFIENVFPGGQIINEQRRFHPEQALFYAYKLSKSLLKTPLGIIP